MNPEQGKIPRVEKQPNNALLAARRCIATALEQYQELEGLMTGIDPSTRDYLLNKVYLLSSEAQLYIDKKVYAGVGVLLVSNLKKIRTQI